MSLSRSVRCLLLAWMVDVPEYVLVTVVLFLGFDSLLGLSLSFVSWVLWMLILRCLLVRFM